jgi:hypothetical protein
MTSARPRRQVLIPTEQLDQVRALMRGFIAWHRGVTSRTAPSSTPYFDAAAFEPELAGLPGVRHPAAACCSRGGWATAGCVALRGSTLRCEMKRMFVYPCFMVRGSAGRWPRR